MLVKVHANNSSPSLYSSGTNDNITKVAYIVVSNREGVMGNSTVLVACCSSNICNLVGISSALCDMCAGFTLCPSYYET